MSSDVQKYKKNKIDELQRIYNLNLIRLSSIFNNNIRKIQKSYNNKSVIIQMLVNKYNNDIIKLRNDFKLAIQKINDFVFDFNVTNINNKKGFLIGINYIDTPYELSGCINDITQIKELLSKYGFNDFTIMTDLTPIKPTKYNILNELKNILSKSQSGDLIFFHFSGHGSYTYDNNNDEIDRLDEMIISQDLQAIIDDELKDIITNNLPKNVTLIGLFDSCHSGTILDLKYNYLDSNNYDSYSENTKQTECQGNVIMISGCIDNQTSAEALINNKPHGALTWSFIECINKNISWRELIKSIRYVLKKNNFIQIPQISTDSFYDIDSKCFL